MKRRLLFVALFVGATTPIHAQEAAPKAAIMEGTCHKFTFAGADATPLCEGKLVNMAYPDGHSSFMFVLKDKAVISFYGADSDAVGDKAAVTIEKLTLNLLMGTPSKGGPAKGTCTYTNPYAGPSLVECSVTSQSGKFDVTFVSDGKPPSFMGD